MCGAGLLQIVKSLLGVRSEDSFLASIMGGAQDEEIIVAEGSGAVRHTPPLDKGHVGIVAAGIGARGNRAIGSTLNVRFDNIAVLACHVVVVEAILDFFGDALLGAVIVMDLHDEPVLLAFGGGAVGGAGARFEVGQGIEHRGRVVAVDVEAKLHSLTGALVSMDGLGIGSCRRREGG